MIRFQTAYFWPSHCWAPENTDYAVYLCKRTMQNKVSWGSQCTFHIKWYIKSSLDSTSIKNLILSLESRDRVIHDVVLRGSRENRLVTCDILQARLQLADYEAENLARLQKMFSRKWEFIFMQAEAQAKVAKKRDKQERKILDSQERAFWDVYRPPPGQVNTTETDIKKMYKLNQIFGQEQTPVLETSHLTRQLAALQVILNTGLALSSVWLACCWIILWILQLSPSS